MTLSESPTAMLRKKYGLVVTPIHRAVGSDALNFEGTGVLVATNCRWLFTAAHVLGEREVVFVSGEKPVVISRDRVGISPPELDLAYVELAPAEAASLEAVGLRFLPFQALDVSTDEFSPERDGCLIAGYPTRSVDVDGDERKIRAQPTTVTSQFLTPRERQGLSLKPGLQLAVKFAGLSDPNGGLKGFDPKGMSGSGIWRREADDLRLAGIVTDYDPKRNILIGTRLRPMLEEILRHLREDN